MALFERQGRKLRLTNEGRAFARVAAEAIDRLTDHAVALRARRHAPVVTLATLPSVAARWLAPRLAEFVAAHPDIDLRIAASPQLVDFDSDGIDAAIRYGTGNWHGVAATWLGGEELLPVCSPGFGQRHSLSSPADLRRCTLLQGDLPDQWRDWLNAAGVSADGLEHGLVFDDANALLRAAEDGVGVALGRSRLVGADLRSGRLIAPFEQRIPATYGYWFVTSEHRSDDVRIGQVRTWLLDQFAAAE